MHHIKMILLCTSHNRMLQKRQKDIQRNRNTDDRTHIVRTCTTFYVRKYVNNTYNLYSYIYTSARAETHTNIYNT